MTFLIDLWQDLREKRLWPVAVGLVAAIVALPFVLLKPASGDSGSNAPAPLAAAPTGVQLPALNVDVNAVDKGSNLDTFSAHDPFKPMKDLTKTGTAGGSTTATPSAPKAAAPTGSGSGSGSGSSSSGGSGSGSSGSGGTPSAVGSPLVTQHTTSWVYTATFKFGTPDHMKTYKDAQPFTLLPDDTNASIMYASAGADGKSAIFYIQDVRFQPTGEGHCNAPGAKCHFVTMKTDQAHDEEAFISTDGLTEYDVQLVSITRKTLSDSGSGSSSKGSTGSKTNGKTVAGAGRKTAQDTGLDILPVLLGFSNTTTTRTVSHAR